MSTSSIPSISAADSPAEPNPRHAKVYSEPGRFGGWPANFGIWNWGNEILVGFAMGTYKNLGPDRHHIDREKPEEHCLARSLDGGETWAIERPSLAGHLIGRAPSLHGIEDPAFPLPKILPSPGGINFAHPDFCMALRMTNIQGGAGVVRV